MRKLIVISSILLLLIGAWGCSENTEQSAKEAVGEAAETAAEKTTDAAETVQAGTVKAAEDVTEKAKKVIDEMKEQTEGSTQETTKE